MIKLSTNADNPEQLRKELVNSFAEFESSFRKRFPIIWTVTLLLPIVLTVLILVSLGLANDWDYPRNIVSHALFTFFVLGRFIILVGLEGAALENFEIAMSPSELFVMVTYMDFMAALFVTFHMNFLFRTPYLGPKVAMLVWDGKFILDSHPWVKRIAFLGLILFVMFPTSTTGSIGGSIFGRLLGMGRGLTVSGILLGKPGRQRFDVSIFQTDQSVHQPTKCFRSRLRASPSLFYWWSCWKSVTSKSKKKFMETESQKSSDIPH